MNILKWGKPAWKMAGYIHLFFLKKSKVNGYICYIGGRSYGN